jgi:hypothetical protein
LDQILDVHFFQGLEKGMAGFSKDWKKARDFFQSLENLPIAKGIPGPFPSFFGPGCADRRSVRAGHGSPADPPRRKNQFHTFKGVELVFRGERPGFFMVKWAYIRYTCLGHP